jgi:hypothetical protein
MRTLATKGPWNQFKESTFLDTQQLDHTFLSNWSPWMGPDILKPMDTTTLNVKTELWFHDPPVAKNIWRCLAFPYLYLPNAGLSCSQPTSLKYKRICKIQKIQIFIIHMLKTICNIYICIQTIYTILQNGYTSIIFRFPPVKKIPGCTSLLLTCELLLLLP